MIHWAAETLDGVVLWRALHLYILEAGVFIRFPFSSFIFFGVGRGFFCHQSHLLDLTTVLRLSHKLSLFLSPNKHADLSLALGGNRQSVSERGGFLVET